jgi:hypothetical protein
VGGKEKAYFPIVGMDHLESMIGAGMAVGGVRFWNCVRILNAKIFR